MAAKFTPAMTDAMNLGYELMMELGKKTLGEGLQERGWSFGFNNTKRSLGMCRYNKWKGVKQILLSTHWVNLNGVEAMEDTIRHEIAHAVDFERRGRSAHDDVWKGIAVEVGARPERCGGQGMVKPERRYKLYCKACGKTYGSKDRLTKGRYWLCRCRVEGVRQYVWVHDTKTGRHFSSMEAATHSTKRAA